MKMTAKEIKKRCEYNEKKGLYSYRAYIGRDQDGKMIRKTIKGSSINDIINQLNEIETSKEAFLKKKETFEILAEEYIAVKKSKNRALGTIMVYSGSLARIKRISPWFMDLTLDEIDRKAADRLIAELSEAGLQSSTIKNTLAVLRGTMRYNEFKVPQLEMPESADSEDEEDDDAPDKPWVDALLKAAEGTDLWLPIFITAYGPLRRGEVCAITLDKVSKRKDADGVEKTFIRINRSRKRAEQGGYMTGDTKNRSSRRTITFPAWLYDRIMAQGYIIDTNPDRFYIRYLELENQAGLKHHRFHSLRHFFASYYLGQGKPITWVAKRGGWESDSPVLLRIYNHLLESQRLSYDADFMENLNDIA